MQGVHPLDLAVYPWQYKVYSLLEQRSCIRATLQHYSANRTNSCRYKRVARLDFITNSLHKYPSLRVPFGLWAHRNNFNPNNDFLVKRASQRVIDFSEIGAAEAYINEYGY